MFCHGAVTLSPAICDPFEPHERPIPRRKSDVSVPTITLLRP
jgi:hypothetical protein